MPKPIGLLPSAPEPSRQPMFRSLAELPAAINLNSVATWELPYAA